MARRSSCASLLLLALLVLAPAAQAGELIDRAASELQQDNVYVDPDADPTLTDEQAQALRERISSEGAGPMYVAVMPRGDRAARPAATRAGHGADRPGGRRPAGHLRARRRPAASAAARASLDAGVTGEIIDAAIEDGGGDLNTILLDVTDQVGEAAGQRRLAARQQLPAAA